ncbi:MAG TPA: ArdC-like ssDNA-binding domain-containing protein [Candidatus Methylomirabilis sp.]|nr:ArdC-like ssDNA-binding domain-containing protein [Candidatus Methylomirabilis sp.]
MITPETRNKHIKEAMDTILKIFNEDNLEKVAHAVFRGGDIPADKWSFLNRLLMYLNDTEDARGFKQWQQTGRYVKKGSKAFYILAPIFKNITEEKTSAPIQSGLESGDIQREEKQILAGFKTIPVFRLEDTTGAPLIKEDFKVNIPYEFNGMINELGLKINTVRFSGISYGSYNLFNKEIKLASPDLEVFFHELSHAVDDRLNGLKPGQRKDQEVTAEFSGAVIGYLMGYKMPLGNIKEYIESYSFKELLSSLSRIEKIVNFVIERTKVGVGQPISYLV